MAARRPRIGISVDTAHPDPHRRMLELNSDYVDAVERAGGVPVLLPHTRNPDLQHAYLDMIDGLLISGGDDIDPRLFGQDPLPETKLMDVLRQDFDLAMLALAQARNMPTLGVCLGMQTMNVQRRGSLYQSIVEEFPESPVLHTRLEAHDPSNPSRSRWHDIMLRPGTHLAAIFGTDTVRVTSRHRQAVDRLGRGLVASAFAPDGIIEAIEDISLRYYIGVQWHAENMKGTEQERLFAGLVEAAAADVREK